nr:immunoglobulin light chain junction region [Macaca mulatta]
CMQALEFLYSF